MAKTLGYMLTFTTYGTWLQGNKRGYVEDGKIYPANKSLMNANERLQRQDTVTLTKKQRLLAQIAILTQSQIIGQKIIALSIGSNHVHIVAEYVPIPIERIVAYYKKAIRLALKESGLKGKVWTTGYDVRYCFDKIALDTRVEYVQKHKKNN